MTTAETNGEREVKTAVSPVLSAFDAEYVHIACHDGVVLGGHYWRSFKSDPQAVVIVNAATGVQSKYYRYYAKFLCEQGFDVLTYDYRGVGASRPQSLRGCGYRWRDWGELDFDAALRWATARAPHRPIRVVGHSIGGFLPGFAPSAALIDRMLTVGAQYAYWPDYAPKRRAALVAKWHLFMPLATALCGYFPGKRLGWLEDLPAGVAYEWSFRRQRMELSHPPAQRAEVLARFRAVRAPILAVTTSDDEFGTPAAIQRGLSYYAAAPRRWTMIDPQDYGFQRIGHFDLFHARHRDGFWRDSVAWLRDGINPWPRAQALST